jgi:hypothetical protein
MIHFKQDEVYTFKLNSGEELIGKVTSENTDWLLISGPVSVAPGPQGMGLVPSLFTVSPDETVKLNIQNISLYAATEDAVKDKYIEATTGIKLPSKKLILG